VFFQRLSEGKGIARLQFVEWIRNLFKKYSKHQILIFDPYFDSAGAVLLVQNAAPEGSYIVFTSNKENKIDLSEEARISQYGKVGRILDVFLWQVYDYASDLIKNTNNQEKGSSTKEKGIEEIFDAKKMRGILSRQKNLPKQYLISQIGDAFSYWFDDPSLCAFYGNELKEKIDNHCGFSDGCYKVDISEIIKKSREF